MLASIILTGYLQTWLEFKQSESVYKWFTSFVH